MTLDELIELGKEVLNTMTYRLSWEKDIPPELRVITGSEHVDRHKFNQFRLEALLFLRAAFDEVFYNEFLRSVIEPFPKDVEIALAILSALKPMDVEQIMELGKQIFDPHAEVEMFYNKAILDDPISPVPKRIPYANTQKTTKFRIAGLYYLKYTSGYDLQAYEAFDQATQYSGVENIVQGLKILKNNSIPLTPEDREQLEKLREYYQSGATYREMAVKLSCSPSNITRRVNLLEKMGLVKKRKK